MPIKITREMLRSLFSTNDYKRGFDYYQKGRVLHFKFSEEADAMYATCTVQGGQDYDVELIVFADGRLGGHCSCPRFEDTHRCKHLIAALLVLVDHVKEASPHSSSGGQRLLAAYQNRNLQGAHVDSTRLARLVPQIHMGIADAYPTFSFQVGFDRLYVVRDIRAFLGAVRDSQVVAYGKNLSFCHDLKQFDALSQQIIRLLMQEFPEFRSFSYHYPSYYYNYPSRSKNEISPEGDAFHQWFTLLLDQEVNLAVSRSKTIRFQEGDPQVSVSLAPAQNRMQVNIETTPSCIYFGNTYHLYAMSGTVLFHCSQAFQQQVYPLLVAAQQDIFIGKTELPSFCSFVLPEIEDLVTIHAPDDLLADYLPDLCTPCYYFDLQEDVLTAKLLFRYGETEIPPAKPPSRTPSVKRNIRTEQTALLPLEQHLHKTQKTGLFTLDDEDEIFAFLTEKLHTFHDFGEVFISQSLRSRRIDSSRVNVGISVSDGLLTLDIDTSEFPPEELEALYHSLLKKRTYHRLPDGRYLELNGSPYEALAEATHMLQLPADKLKDGQVTVPAFRALYLDSVLKEEEHLSIHRDHNYRALLRDFKAVSDSEHLLPAHLESVLRPYQKFGFQWLKTLNANGFGGILADEMGLGKTAQMIAFLSTMPRAKTGLPSLVVCPASLILNWADECVRFAPELKVRLLMGTTAERKQAMQEAAEDDLWVTSYDLLKRDIDVYETQPFYAVILDEGQNIKNKASLASKSVKQLNCSQRFVMTGTPIENRLSELWNLFDFLMPGYLFSHNAFVNKLEKPIAQSKNPDASRRLGLMVQPFLLRRMKQDVLRELPPKIEHVQKIILSTEERKTYLAFAEMSKRALLESDQGKLQILAALTHLRQLCCDPNLCVENYNGETSKLEACIELCTSMVSNGHQILLFSQFTTMLERIEHRLSECGISSFTLRGSTPKEKRAQLVKSFQAGGASVFLISLKAGGTGLNLTAADVVIHYDPWWNLAAQNQATDRAHRIGQQTSVQVYKLIAKDTIEEKILELQNRKAALMDVISADPELDIGKLSKQELLELFS